MTLAAPTVPARGAGAPEAQAGDAWASAGAGPDCACAGGANSSYSTGTTDSPLPTDGARLSGPAVCYPDRWFYVEESAHQTRATFALLMHLSRLDLAAGSALAPPPAGR
jgi:hypothetical protein